MKQAFEYHAPDKGATIKIWRKGVTVEDVALQQLRNISNLPFVFRHVAAMPDAHIGKSAAESFCSCSHGARPTSPRPLREVLQRAA